MMLESLHPQAQALLDELHDEGGPALSELSVDEAREIPAALRELIGPGPEVAEVRDVSFSGPAGELGARVYEPVAEPPGTVVYYHGGGWVLVTLDDCDAVCRALALETGCRVVSIDYRLAPEHPFPAAVDDAYAALVWVDGAVAGGRPIVVAGDSAGGNLSAVVSLRARDEHGPAIALQVLVYPVTDHDYTTGSYERYADAGLLLGKQEMVWFWDHYAPSEEDWSSPYASPLRAEDHSGLPPAYILIAEYDPLRDEGLAYAEKLRAAGVPVTVRRFNDQLHAFFHMVNLMESANLAVHEVGQAIRQSLGHG
jgi:acetyl esterase